MLSLMRMHITSNDLRVAARCLCRQHLLGDHGELHKHRHNFLKQHRMDGRIAGNAVEPMSMEAWHDAIEAEARSRGYKFNSPFEQPDISYLPCEQRHYKIDVYAVRQLLIGKCPDCADRMAHELFD